MTSPEPFVFVVGTGRSGTHWLGYILDSHPDISMTIEAEGVFDLVVQMALDPSKRQMYFPELERQYRSLAESALPLHYGDKSHPNLWLIEELAAAFDEARFIGIQRDPYATVASMMAHGGVRAWHDRWREFPLPNQFLGIDVLDAEGYDDLSLATKCAMRWRSHHHRMVEEQALIGARMLTVSYERLVYSPGDELEHLRRFLGLEAEFPPQRTRTESLHKWRSALSASDKADIEEVVGFPPHGHGAGP